MFNRFFNSLKKEIFYHFIQKKWTFKEVGKFWDSQSDYDDINSKIYPYLLRFYNSKKIFGQPRIKNFKPKKILDIQTRTGKGSIFWSKFFPEAKFYICDFSKNFISISKKNMKKNKLNYKAHLIKKLPLPFNAQKFDLILCYETIEHIYNFKSFIKELSRVSRSKAILILTMPNTSWKFVHFISTIIGINHSEGPHKFIKKRILDETLKNNNFKILNYNTTIFLPFNNTLSIKIDKVLNKKVPNIIKRLFFLRHSYICEKK